MLDSVPPEVNTDCMGDALWACTGPMGGGGGGGWTTCEISLRLCCWKRLAMNVWASCSCDAISALGEWLPDSTKLLVTLWYKLVSWFAFK